LIQQFTKPAKLSGISDSIWSTTMATLKYEALDSPETKGPETFEPFKWNEKLREGQQEAEYTKYMTHNFKIPKTIQMVSNARATSTLNCEPKFLPFPIRGGVDVYFVLRRFAEHHNEAAGIVLMMEVKKPQALQDKSSAKSCFRQAFMAQVAGDCLSQKVVTTVLTDLGEHWEFFFGADDTMYTVMLSRTEAIINIQRLLALSAGKEKLPMLENDPFPENKRQKLALNRMYDGRAGVEEQDLEGCMPLHELKSWRLGQALPYLLPHSLREFHSSGLTAEALSMFI